MSSKVVPDRELRTRATLRYILRDIRDCTHSSRPNSRLYDTYINNNLNLFYLEISTLDAAMPFRIYLLLHARPQHLLQLLAPVR